ncbi:MAG TPA: PASTA domain-containing protein [Gaiellaceae bacterium]|nr:PASTA domain-containing protein [Gaiellaceae bacterium]
MSAFVEECRKEWRRLGVPDLLAEEMATDLEADLAEAEADGVSATEMLGESDPRRFAATWASERGLVSEPAPQKKRRRRFWPWILAAFLFIVIVLSWLALQTFGSSGARSAPPAQVTPVAVTHAPSHRVVVPDLVGERRPAALASARAAGLAAEVRIGTAGTVVRQQPAPGTSLRRGSTIRLFVARR